MEKFRLFFERVVARIRGYYTKADGYEKIDRVFRYFDEMLVDLKAWNPGSKLFWLRQTGMSKWHMTRT